MAPAASRATAAPSSSSRSTWTSRSTPAVARRWAATRLKRTSTAAAEAAAGEDGAAVAVVAVVVVADGVDAEAAAAVVVAVAVEAGAGRKRERDVSGILEPMGILKIGLPVLERI